MNAPIVAGEKLGKILKNQPSDREILTTSNYIEATKSNTSALLAAADAIEKSKVKDYIYYRRYASEAAAQAAIGGDAINLDTATKGYIGGNYPIYDISSSLEVASVKTHWNSSGDLSDTSVNSYVRDFDTLLGWNREVDALTNDGLNIIKAREQGISVPKDISSASGIEAGLYLRDSGKLRIPDDHVKRVRDAIETRARKFPANYFLPESFGEQDIYHLVNRIDGIGITSKQLQLLLSNAEN